MTCSLVTFRVNRPMWMRVGRGVGDFSRLRRIEFERLRLRSLERFALSLDFERRSDDPLRLLPSRSELKRPRSRDFGRSFPSFSFESGFLAGLRLFLGLFDLDWRRLRRSPPLLDDEDDEELLELDEDDELDELELSLELEDPERFLSFRTDFSSFTSFDFSTIFYLSILFSKYLIPGDAFDVITDERMSSSVVS